VLVPGTTSHHEPPRMRAGPACQGRRQYARGKAGFIDGFTADAGNYRPATPSSRNAYGFSQSILIFSRPRL
jgi:hypothetical protein